MKSHQSNKQLDEFISQAVGRERPTFDFNKWKRKHKFSASSMAHWEQIKQAGDRLAPKLTVMRSARQ